MVYFYSKKKKGVLRSHLAAKRARSIQFLIAILFRLFFVFSEHTDCDDFVRRVALTAFRIFCVINVALKRAIYADVRLIFYYFTWRCFKISTKENLINEEIKIPEVRLVGNDGEMLGIVKIAKAHELAAEKDLDLVLISPSAVPPVCKIMDYGKFCFEKEKRAKEAKKKQQVVDVKEIQLSCTIGDHDFQTKLNHAFRFLKGGDKVKVVVRFRGREMRHTELGQEILARFEKGCEGIGVAEKKAVLDGRNMTMFIAPVKQ